MPTLILHHYYLSPFSQKVRSMLGYAGLEWQSVRIESAPPRPALEQLAGGYRKVPVAQIGADIFCDTVIIAAEITRLSGKPDISLGRASEAEQAYARHTDVKIFFACLFAAGSWALAKTVWREMTMRAIVRFFADRVQIGRTSSVRSAPPSAAKAVVRKHLVATEARLQDHDFLFADVPHHADFSTYHSLWFMRDIGQSSLLADFPKTNAWMDRIGAFGEGERGEISADAALLAATSAEPRAIAAEHKTDARVGQRVRISPVDYAKDPTEGVLVGVSDERFIIARETPALGVVHVHLPQVGYRLDVC
ncbi:MAG: glutathione S-transferase family protein [Paraperlucidibaca sp.]